MAMYSFLQSLIPRPACLSSIITTVHISITISPLPTFFCKIARWRSCKFRTPDMVPRKPVRFLGLLGTLRPRNGSRVEFPETACGFDSGPGREPRELAIDEAN